METNDKIKEESQNLANRVLVDGFWDDNELEAVFLIQASSEDVFNNRRRKLQEITGFSDGGCGSCEKDEECDVWKVIVTGYFSSLENLKEKIKIMSKYKWLFLSDSCILSDGDYIFSHDEWFP